MQEPNVENADDYDNDFGKNREKALAKVPPSNSPITAWWNFMIIIGSDKGREQAQHKNICQ
jgi:hypothetical protein